MEYLVVLESGSKKRYAIKQKVIVVGRGEGCSLKLSDPSVAEQHCKLERTSDGFRLTDLGSDTGTRLNNKKVASALIREKEIIQIGNVQMGIQVDDAPVEARDPQPETEQPVSNASVGQKSAGSGQGGLEIKPEFKNAAKQGKNRLVRRKLRRGSKIPGWAQAVIACWVIVAVVGVAIFVLNQAKPSPYQEQFLAAKNLESEGKAEAAIAIFEKIPLSDPDFGQRAVEEVKKLSEEIRQREVQTKHKSSVSYFENNIKLFIHKYIDAPEGDKAKAKTILKKYAVHRKSYVRVLMLDRLNYYIDNYKGNRDYAEVEKLVEKYAEEYDPLAPVYYEDAEIEAEMWMNLHNYGEAQKALLGWKEDQRGEIVESDLRRLEETLGNIEKLLINEWNMREDYVAEMEAKGNFKEANSIYHRMMSRCEGYDTPLANEFMAVWKKKFDENERRIQEQQAKLKDVF